MLLDLALVAEARLAVGAPEGAAREPESVLPVVNVSGLDGARVIAREGYTRGPLTLRVLCATGPADGWAPGIEELILGRASQLARGAMGVNVTRLDAGDIESALHVFTQPFTGTAEREADRLSLSGRHWLGFAGQPRAAIMCSVACTEPASDHVCAPLLAASGPVGTWEEAPPPNVVARTILLAAEKPYAALAVLALIATALAMLIIARRPIRPRA